ANIWGRALQKHVPSDHPLSAIRYPLLSFGSRSKRQQPSRIRLHEHGRLGGQRRIGDALAVALLARDDLAGLAVEPVQVALEIADHQRAAIDLRRGETTSA